MIRLWSGALACSGSYTPRPAGASGTLGVDRGGDHLPRPAHDRFVPLGPAQDERPLEAHQELGRQVERPLPGDPRAAEGVGYDLLPGGEDVGADEADPLAGFEPKIGLQQALGDMPRRMMELWPMRANGQSGNRRPVTLGHRSF